VFAVLHGFVEGAHDHPPGDEAQGNVDEEDPAPGGEFGEHAAEGGPDDGGDRPHAGEVTLGFGALGDGVDVAGDGDRHGHDGAGAEALHGPEGDQGGHAPGEAAEDRAEQEDGDAEQENRFAADDIGQLGVDRHRHGLGEQVDGEQPWELRESADVFHDGGHRGGEDGRLDGYEPGGQHEGDEDGSAFRPEADVPSSDTHRMNVTRVSYLVLTLDPSLARGRLFRISGIRVRERDARDTWLAHFC
jgi:hypothetical protein